MKANNDDVLREVTKRYLTSGTFNGTPISHIDGDDAERRTVAAALVTQELIALNFGDRHPNPHVQALPPEPVEAQLHKLTNTDDLAQVCMYPTPVHLKAGVKADDYHGQPFTARLALGEHLFVFLPFDLRVLEKYRNDPRYLYESDDIQGWISVKNEFFESAKMKEGDQVIVKQFGFGYDDDMNRCVMMMLCDLAVLSPEHQQIWALEQIEGAWWPHPNYVDSVMGRWPEKESLFTAFTLELKTINGMAALMGRPAMFREDFTERQRPRKFGFLIRPTLGEYNDFALLLDKMISDNINMDFFQGEVASEFLEERADGVKIARQKGSLRALQEWLDLKAQFPEPEPKNEMLATFKRIRKVRQNPAHSINEDAFDQKYFKDQRQLAIDAYKAVRLLRLILANDPQAKQYEVPEWLRKGDIWTY